MPGGLLDLTEPVHLLAKLEHESTPFAGDPSNCYAVINALRDAYHLREWIWPDRFEHNQAIHFAIMGVPDAESDWNASIVRELCNGSKHFEHGTG